MIMGPVLCPSLIGRTRELRDLADRRLAAAKGRGGLVLIGGDVGIGKSRLVRAFRETLTGGRARFGIGYCCESGNRPFGPLIDALKCLGSDPPLLAAQSKSEQAAAIGDALRRSCQRRNAVLVLEDVQWADAGTMGLLVHLLPSLGSLRLLIVATYRSDVLHDEHLAAPYVARLRRFASTIALEPLSDREVRRLVRLAASSVRLIPAEQDGIVERAEGNPFFAEELLRSVLERRRSSRNEPLPLTIRAAVQERLAELDGSTLAIAQRASIFGRQFQSNILAEVSERPHGDVLVALRRLRELQIIVETASSDRFAFRHVLTRDVIYATMLAQEVRPIHARVLRLLEASAEANAYDLGYHAWAAADAERCVLYNERAGDEADTLHAYADAVRCYGCALEFAVAFDVRSRLLAKAAAATSRDGKSQEAVELYDAATAASEAVGDRRRAAELRGAMAVQARLACDNERAVAILTRALEALDPFDEGLRAELSLHLAFCKLNQADAQGADALLCTSASAAPPPLRWSVACYAAAVKGDIAAVRATELPYLDACLPSGRAAMLQARFNVGYDLCVLGADAEGLAILDAILPELRALRLPSLEVLSCANAALVHARSGDLKEARALVRRGLDVPERLTTGPITLAAAALTVGNLLGDEELIADAVSEDVIETAFRSKIDVALASIAGPYARWLWTHGEERGAREVLERALRELRGTLGATETLLAAIELGDDATVEAARCLAARVEATSGVPLYAATTAHVRALLAQRTGEPDAPNRAREAESLYRSLGWPLHAARCAELCGSSRSVVTFRKFRAAGDMRRTLSLSARETQIAELVADGISNKVLAARFTISQRSIEKHLTSIYTKLGLRNRSELVALMTRRKSAEARA